MKEKQVEEMAEAIFHYCNCGLFFSEAEKIARFVIEEQGYEKRSEGEWIGMDGDVCSKCGKQLSDIMDADSYYAIGFDINEIVACPFCGAKMKGGEENETQSNKS